MTLFARRRAADLHRKGMRLRDDGDEDGALKLYEQAAALDPGKAETLYNIGLIHKYRRAWPESFAFNRRALALQPQDEATRWNLGIAATALGDWTTAREVWTACGFDVGEGDGPIQADFGLTPVRLIPDDDAAEVVWARRLDPVRARITSIPFLASGYFHGDVVLHDGAATGYRMHDEVEKPVFNVFERLERSAYATVTAVITAPSRIDVEALEAACDAARTPCENWTENIQWLCRQCSEGTPHDEHDQDLPDPVWSPEQDFAFATGDRAVLDDLLRQWSARPGCGVGELIASD